MRLNGFQDLLICALALVSASAIGGCSGEATRSTSLQAPPPPPAESTVYGPEPNAASPGSDIAASASADSSDTTDAAPSTDVSGNDGAAQADRATTRREDGRPSWWIDGVQRANGEILIAAEALGPDIRAARRAAIDAGVARLGRELGQAPSDWVVKATIIRPLRAVRGPDNVNRFVGYVLVAASD